jgi:hypothetical protein
MGVRCLKTFRILICTCVVAYSGVRASEPFVGQTSASPTAVHAGSRAQVQVTAHIDELSVIPASVVLQRLNPDGKFTTLGVLHDDGLNGDASLGDRVYTLEFGVNQSSPVTLRYRVAAAFRGILRRKFSETLTVNVRANISPEQMLSMLSSELLAGDIEAALSHFSPSPLNRSALLALSPSQRAAVANAFRAATLVRISGDARLYQVAWTDDVGNPIALEVGLIQGPSGDWIVTNW